MHRKRLMILGASILQLPAIQKAQSMGIEVIAVDMDKKAVGFKHADISLNISTLDSNKVLEAAEKYEIDGIMTLASDMPIRTVAKVAEELNLVGVSTETAINVTNKASMRMKLKLNNVPVPKFFKVCTFEEYIKVIKEFDEPFIVKPADNSGSRGVFLVKDDRDTKTVTHAFEYSQQFSRSGEIVVEEYMSGPEVSVETFSINGQTKIIAITDKYTTGAPNFVEMGHSIPSILSSSVKIEIEKVVKAAVTALEVKNGPTHTEVIVTPAGPKIVEVGARLGGDNITTHLVPLATGVDLVKACIKIALGEVPELEQTQSLGSAIRYFNTDEYSTLKDIQGIEGARQLMGVKDIVFNKNIGEMTPEISSSVDRIGYVIAQSRDASSAIKICEDVLKQVKFIYY